MVLSCPGVECQRQLTRVVVGSTLVFVEMSVSARCLDVGVFKKLQEDTDGRTTRHKVGRFGFLTVFGHDCIQIIKKLAVLGIGNCGHDHAQQHCKDSNKVVEFQIDISLPQELVRLYPTEPDTPLSESTSCPTVNCPPRIRARLR